MSGNLKKLDIQVKQDLTRTTRIINFKEISQQDLREEVKKAIYFQLKTESIGTVKKRNDCHSKVFKISEGKQ